jgi:hypothetical protein
MITLIATFCFLTNASVCAKIEIPLREDVSMMQCFMGAQPTTIEYLKQHPYIELEGRTFSIANFNLDRLTCTPQDVKQPDKGF